MSKGPVDHVNKALDMLRDEEPSAAEKTRVANIARKPPGQRTEEEKELMRRHMR